MNQSSDSSALTFEMLKRFGARWAVLTAMAADMANQGIDVLGDVAGGLQTARAKITSGCYSPCEAGCELSQIESQLFSRGDLLDPEEFKQWCELLAEAMQGKLDYQRIGSIPALTPVRNDCGFLNCGCTPLS